MRPLTPERARGWKKYATSSPLYTHLTDLIADDEELMMVLNSIENPPRHNILFAAVQYLMMSDGGGGLERFYPNFTESPDDRAGVGAPFREFVLAHSSEIAEIGRTRYTQTNECRRCVALLPGVWATPAERFHLVDFGTSAGLNLHLDRYRYKWGRLTWGPASPVHLATENRGAQIVPREIDILSRTGLDVSPIDPSDSENRMWLEALIWPEHHERRERLQAALSVAEANPVSFVTGDAVETLVETLRRLPEGESAVVINSFILNQFKPVQRKLLGELIHDGRRCRDIYRVSLEWLDEDSEGADLSVDDGAGLRKIGLAQPHGEWLELYARP